MKLLLEPKELAIFLELWCNHMDGNTMAQTACKLNISKQDLKYHIGNLFAKIPEIRSVFPKIKQTLRKHQALHMQSKFEQKVKQPQQSFLPLG